MKRHRLPDRDRARLLRAARIWRKVVERDKHRKYDTDERRGRITTCLAR